MNEILSKANIINHKNTKRDKEPFIIRNRAGLLHVCIGSNGCRYGHKGSCVMCNYGLGTPISYADIQNLFKIVKDKGNSVDSILIGTYGSIFDTNEVSEEIFDYILDNLLYIDIETIIFETHYCTINDEILDKISRKLYKKNIVIELGLESANETIRENCLNKYINTEQFLDKIKIIHRHNMCVTVNVFLGAPFLSLNEQIDDSLITIKWAFDHNIDDVVIFPANIRKHTLLSYLYEHNKYAPISGWALVEVINRVPNKYQERISLSWYGDWGKNEDIIFPKSCEKCEQKLIAFFNEYLKIKKGDKRRKFIENFLNEINLCDCYSDFINEINKKNNCSKNFRIKKHHEWLTKNINSKS